MTPTDRSRKVRADLPVLRPIGTVPSHHGDDRPPSQEFLTALPWETGPTPHHRRERPLDMVLQVFHPVSVAARTNLPGPNVDERLFDLVAERVRLPSRPSRFRNPRQRRRCASRSRRRRGALR